MKDSRIEVKICTGTTCYILGGSRYLRLSDNLDSDVLSRINITGSPCMGYCEKSNTKQKLPCITIDGTTYHGLSLEETVEIITKAVSAVPAL